MISFQKRRKLEKNNNSGAAEMEVSDYPKKVSLEGKADEAMLKGLFLNFRTWQTDRPTDESANPHAMYELIGVLTHVGRTADAGHYMAWTRSQENGMLYWTGVLIGSRISV